MHNCYKKDAGYKILIHHSTKLHILHHTYLYWVSMIFFLSEEHYWNQFLRVKIYYQCCKLFQRQEKNFVWKSLKKKQNDRRIVDSIIFSISCQYSDSCVCGIHLHFIKIYTWYMLSCILHSEETKHSLKLSTYEQFFFRMKFQVYYSLTVESTYRSLNLQLLFMF